MENIKLFFFFVWIHAFKPLLLRIGDIKFKIQKFLKSCKEKHTFLVMFFIIFSLVLVLGYFYLYKNTQDENFAVGYAQLVSGWIAGSLTMIGVAWTINKQTKIQKEERRLSIKPYFVFTIKPLDENVVSVKINIPVLLKGDGCLLKNDVENISESQMGNNECLCTFNPFHIYNSSFSECTIYAIRFRKENYYLDTPLLLKKNTYYCLDLCNLFFLQRKRNKLTSPDLCVLDMQDNEYFISVDTDEGEVSTDEGDVKNKDDINVIHLQYTVIGLDFRNYSYRLTVKKEDIKSNKEIVRPSYTSELKKLKNIKTLIRNSKKLHAEFEKITHKK